MKQNIWSIVSIIKNGYKSNKTSVILKIKNLTLLNSLWDEGFILGYRQLKQNNFVYEVFLKYKKNGEPSLKKLNLLTLPSHRYYLKTNQLSKIKFSYGILLLSTNKGFLTAEKSKKINTGGELYFFFL